MVKLETINDQSSRTSLTITASSSSSLDSNNSEAVANEDLSGVVVGAGHEEKLSFKTWLFNWISWRRRQQLLNQQIVAKVVVEQQDDRRAKAVGEKETLPWRWRAGEEAEGGVVANGDLPREHPFQQQNGEHDHEVIKLISSDESLESSSGEDDVREETEWFVGDGTGIDLQPKKAAAVAGEDGGTLGNMQAEVLLQKHASTIHFKNLDSGKTVDATGKVATATQKFDTTSSTSNDANGTLKVKEIDLGGTTTKIQFE